MMMLTNTFSPATLLRRFAPGLLILGAVLLMVSGCDQAQRESSTAQEAPMPRETQPAPAPLPPVIELVAVGKTFRGPAEIAAGWTTFRFTNASSMVHFGIVDVPPQGISAQEMSTAVMDPFQDAMDAINAGDTEAMNEAFGRFPAWLAELGRAGGPGFLSPGRVGETTVYLEPGYYIIECYVKSDGVFHTTSPGEGQLGMLLPLRVTSEDNGAQEPDANVTVTLSNDGIEITAGAFVAGANSVRVEFAEQQALPSFVGNDVHLMRVSSSADVDAAAAWMDWMAAEGLEDPSPVEFLGGINDQAAGTHGYFSVDLEPGDYALIGEMPNPQEAGYLLRFSAGD